MANRTSSESAVIRRGIARCPRCNGRLIGYADVTTHPTIKVVAGHVILGDIIDSRARLSREARDLASLTLHDELYCEHACGFRILGQALVAQVSL